MSAPLYEALERRRKVIAKHAAVELKAGELGGTALRKILDLFSAAKRGVKAQPRLSIKGDKGSGLADKIYELTRKTGDKAGSFWAGANKRAMPTGTNLRPAQRGAYSKGRATRDYLGDNAGKLAILAASPAAYPLAEKTGEKIGDVILEAGDSTTQATTEEEKKVFAARRRLRQAEEAKIAAAEEAKKAKREQQGAETSDTWIPGIDNTLTAGAGGAMAGGAGGYALGRHLGWDPITSGIVGSLGTATAAAMLAHHLKQNGGDTDKA